MSERLGILVREGAINALEPLAAELGEQFLDGMGSILEGAPAAAKDKVVTLVKEGFRFKRKALAADNAEDARDYAEAAAKSARRVRTVLLAEEVVASEQTAALVSDLFGKALDGLAAAAKGLVVEVVKSLAKSAIEEFTGGGEDGPDLSSIFPFA